MNKLNYLQVEIRDSVALVRLNRPEVLNALCLGLMDELAQVFAELDRDDAIAVIVLTGNDKAFAAGADITEMKDASFQYMLEDGGLTRHCDSIASCSKPVIAAVAGYALGGGCELAMMCDFIIAADNAKFGQPEITIGTIPGFGGSQRLTRLVGKSKAMDMCLTGRMMDASEAERSGLAARVEPLESYLAAALAAAAKIAGFSRPIVSMARQAVDLALETSLTQGVKTERQMFKSTFALDDQKEGMAAFVEKRSPDFRHR
ncbi:MAG: enoyl-CoA hydratase-related protein [Gammaproteobacteria bacterium]|nr:enoyl-CoA hydratase-related protein [Gammaproteobacteria bacterium]MDH3536586.1 enoyl-CoA hydratase-related protein [Gammaproteobacteria bacterium]